MGSTERAGRAGDPAAVILELVIFGGGVLALYAAGRRRLALMFAGLVVVNEVLLLAWHQ